MKNKDIGLKIGFFDSGHGGLDILREAMSRFGADYYFIGDRANHPYGALPIEVLHQRCVELSRILIEEKNCELIVVACNTATAYAIDHLRENFKVPFVGVEPYLNYINRAAPEKVAHGQVGALVTPNTLKSKRFKELKEQKDPRGLVHAVALAELAPAIEDFVFHRDGVVFEKKLVEIFEGHDFSAWQEAILGCTHYPLVTNHIEKLLNVVGISPTKAIVDQMLRVIGTSEIPSGQEKFWYCDTSNGDWREALMSEFLPLP